VERNLKKNGLVNLLILMVIGAAGFAVARYANSLAGQVAAVLFALGALIAAVSWFQMRLEERERLEKMEFEEVTRSGASATLFNTQETEVFPARRSREQFERYFVPGFTLVLFFLQSIGAWWLWQWVNQAAIVPQEHPLVALGLYAVFFLLLFLVGRYSAGLARLESQRLLQPGANYLLLAAYLCVVVIGGLIAPLVEIPKVDFYAAEALGGLLGLLAVENAVALVLEIYRPRIKGKVARVLYESRLVGLLSHPEGIFTTAAHVLDYQFGFKVSETWFYQFLQKALLWLLLAQLGILLLSTSLVFIEAGQQALLERFGRPRAVLEPGPHAKLPWPIDKVYRFRTDEVQSFNVGLEPGEERERETTLLWTVTHSKKEFNLLVASRQQTDAAANPASGKKSPPVNLLSVGIPVQFRIKNLPAWAYQHQDAGKLLERIATREVVRYLVSIDLHELMSSGRFAAGEELRKRIQTRADELNLGAEILFVGLQDVHPPVKVAASYEAVVGAQQTKKAAILAAEGYKARTNTLAGAEAFKKLRQAEAESQRLEADAFARAALFTNQIPAFEASPAVYTERAYLLALARGGEKARKIINLASTNTEEVILLNLEERVRTDLLEVPVPPAKGK